MVCIIRVVSVIATIAAAASAPLASAQSLPGGPAFPPLVYGGDSPKRLTATAIHHGRVELAWIENIANDTGFEIERRTASGAFTLIGTAPANATSFVDTTTAPATTYAWRVRATLPFGPPAVTDWSLPARATTPKNRPPTLRSTLPADTSIELAAFPALPELAFDVIANDPDGDRVSIRLLCSVPGLICAPCKDAASPARIHVRWNPAYAHSRYTFAGPNDIAYLPHQPIAFEANDDFEPTLHTRLTERLATKEFSTNGASIQFADVTGDGELDTIALATSADATAPDSGALYVWAGATTMNSAPTATLIVPAAWGAAFVGMSGHTPFALEDLTGDGILDLYACAPLADLNGFLNAGAAVVWAGGAGLVGTVQPTATLVDPSGGGVQYELSRGPGALFDDLDGDGVTDVLLGSTKGGNLFWFRGGATMSGTPVPDGTFGPYEHDYFASRSREIDLVDVTGDGRRDLVIAANLADSGSTFDVGAIYVFDGANLTGSPAPLATLSTSRSRTGDRLGDSSTQVLPLFADVTGDGYLDVISAARLADSSSKSDVGAAFVWAGGPAMVGNRSETAALVRTVPQALDGFGTDLAVADVTGDGIPDVIVGSQKLDTTVAVDAGGVVVYAGGPTLTGTAPAWAKLLDTAAVAGDQMRLSSLADLDQDGITDLVLSSGSADLGGVADTGVATVWLGGSALVGTPKPSATLSYSGAASNDQTTFDVLPRDFDGDGALDLLAFAPGADVAGNADAGALLLFAPGKAGWNGTLHETALLTEPAPAVSARFGDRNELRQFADVDGDGHSDLVIGERNAVRNGQKDAGAIYLFAGGPRLVGTLAPSAELDLSHVHKNSLLGTALEIVDVDQDGQLDVVGGAFLDSAYLIGDAGSASIWYGGARLAGVLPSDHRFAVSTAIAFDGLTESVGGAPLTFVDLDHDGDLDFVPSSYDVDWQGVIDSGALYLWFAPLPVDSDPAQTLFVPGAAVSDRLGL